MARKNKKSELALIEEAFIGPFEVKVARPNKGEFPEARWLVPYGREEGRRIATEFGLEEPPLMFPVAAWNPPLGVVRKAYLRLRPNGRVAEALPEGARQSALVINLLEGGLPEGEFLPRPQPLTSELVFRQESGCLRARLPKTGQHVYCFGLSLEPNDKGEVKVGPKSGYWIRGCYYRTFFVLMPAELAEKVSETTLALMDDEQRFAEAMVGTFYGVKILPWQLTGDPTEGVVDLSSFRFDALALAETFERDWLEDRLVNLKPRFIERWLRLKEVQIKEEERDEVVRLASAQFDILVELINWYREWVDYAAHHSLGKARWAKHLARVSGLDLKPSRLRILPPPPESYRRRRVRKLTSLSQAEIESIALEFIKDWLKRQRAPKPAPQPTRNARPAAKTATPARPVAQAKPTKQQTKRAPIAPPPPVPVTEETEASGPSEFGQKLAQALERRNGNGSPPEPIATTTPQGQRLATPEEAEILVPAADKSGMVRVGCPDCGQVRIGRKKLVAGEALCPKCKEPILVTVKERGKKSKK